MIFMRTLLKLLALILILLAMRDLNASMKKIAVIDGGFNPLLASMKTQEHLCKTGHFDFTTNEPIMGLDTSGHSTIVSNSISDTAGDSKYCIVIYKIIGARFNKRNTLVKALEFAYRRRMDAINISLESKVYNEKEFMILNKIIKRAKTIIFVAAGNDNRNLSLLCNVYPACYKVRSNKFRVIGSVDYKFKSGFSNYGSVIFNYENGFQDGHFGTSFASPKALGKYINALGGK